MDSTLQDAARQGENSNVAAMHPSDRLRQLALACLLEAGRRTFVVVSVEAGKKKQRYFDALFRTVVIGHLGFGAPAAKFKNVSDLARMCVISRNTAARGIDELVRLNVLFAVGQTRRPLLLCVNPNVESWLVAKTIGDDAWLTLLAEWRNFCCSTQLELRLPDFGPADPTLQQLLALVNVGNAVENIRPTGGQSDGKCSTVEQEKRPTVGQSAENCPTVEQEKRSTVVQIDEATRTLSITSLSLSPVSADRRGGY